MNALSPVTLGDFTPGRTGFIEIVTQAHGWDTDAVWSALHGERPMHWNRLLRKARWTSPRPFGVGTTRSVTVAPGVVVAEEYFHWHEGVNVKDNAFSVVTSTAPGLRRFGERFTVSATDAGSELRWGFYIEPAIPGLIHLVQPIMSLVLRAAKTDNDNYFAVPPAR